MSETTLAVTLQKMKVVKSWTAQTAQPQIRPGHPATSSGYCRVA